MSERPEWIYPGADVVLYQDRSGALGRTVDLRKVLSCAPKSFLVEGPNTETSHRFRNDRLVSTSYDQTVRLVQPGTLLADELLAERKRDLLLYRVNRAMEAFRREPGLVHAQVVESRLQRYRVAEQGYLDSKAARVAAEASAER